MSAPLRLAALVAFLFAACGTMKPAYTAPAPAGAAAVGGEGAARILVLVVPDADPRLPPLWQEHAAKAADAVEAALRQAGFRTTREALSRWAVRVTVSAPIRGADFSIAIAAGHTVVERLDLNGRDWGAAELAELAKQVRQRVERSDAIAALAGGTPKPAEPAAPAAEPAPARVEGAASSPAKRLLAVLEFRGAATPVVLGLVADQVRAAAAEAGRASGTTVMTRERILAALKERGRPTDPCSDGACEVETARAVGADLVVTGEVSEVGAVRFLVLKLVDTGSGALVASKHAQAANDLALVEAAKPAAAALFQ